MRQIKGLAVIVALIFVFVAVMGICYAQTLQADSSSNTISGYKSADATPVYKDAEKTVNERVSDLLSRMTLDEKVGQMLQPECTDQNLTVDTIKNLYIGSVLSGGDSDPTDGNSQQNWYDMVAKFEKAALETRLGIPLIYGVDAVHGHNNVVGATVFPHNVALGAIAAGDEDHGIDIVKKIGAATAQEMKTTSIFWTFSPCLANPQNISWGRSYEGFGENMDLVTKLAVAYVKGLQGDSINEMKNSDKGVATIKHYLGEGYTEDGINQGNVTSMTKEEVAEKLITPYAEAIKAGARTLMPSFNSIQGVKMHASKYLLTDVLKNQLKFDGFIITDYNGIQQIEMDEAGNTVSGYKNQLKVSINAGNDMLMEVSMYAEAIKLIKELVADEQANAGTGIPMIRIDDAVARILRVKFQAGLFENPITPDPALNSDVAAKMGSQNNRGLAREAVSDSLVLLKNDLVNGKPIMSQLKGMKKIFVAGKTANNMGNQCGGWTIKWQGESGNITKGTTILKGIQDSVGKDKVTYSLDGTGAAGNDVGILVIGELPYAETQGDGLNGLQLDAVDKAALSNLKSAGIPIVVVLVSGRPMDLSEQLYNKETKEALNDIAGLIEAWLPGTEGNGVADVLFGEKDFVGKLPEKWPFYFASTSLMDKMPEQILWETGYGLQKDQETPAMPKLPEHPHQAIPGGATAVTLPGVFESENYTWNSGFTKNKAAGVNFITNFSKDDYAKYYIDVPADGNYNIDLKYTAIRNLTDTISIIDNTNTVLGTLSFPKTNDISYPVVNTWSTVTKTVPLKKGAQLLTLSINGIGTPEASWEIYVNGPAKIDFISITAAN